MHAAFIPKFRTAENLVGKGGTPACNEVRPHHHDCFRIKVFQAFIRNRFITCLILLTDILPVRDAHSRNDTIPYPKSQQCFYGVLPDRRHSLWRRIEHLPLLLPMRVQYLHSKRIFFPVPFYFRFSVDTGHCFPTFFHNRRAA